MAARFQKMKVFVLLRGPNEHCRAHGEKLAEQILIHAHWAEARASVGAIGVTRKRTFEVQCMLAEVPPSAEQVV